MPNNVDAIAQYLVSIGATGGDLLTSDEEEPGFLVSPWITYTLGDDEQPDGNFLLRLRYAPDSGVFQIQFWGRDFGEEWIGTTKHVFVSQGGIATDAIKAKDRKSTRLNSSHIAVSRMPSSA